MLLDTAKKIVDQGFMVPFIYTCKAESFYRCDEEAWRSFAKDIGADFYCDTKINTPERVAEIAAYGCEVAISLNWLTMLKKPICDAFANGIWNAHAGDLPRYRGNACPNWAILNHESQVGLCVHEIEPDALDSGDILMKRYFPLSSDIYIGDVYAWMGEQIPDMFLQTLKQLSLGDLHKTRQSTRSEDILRCYPRKPEDSKIMWKESAKNILALIRASSHPFSGAYTQLEGGMLVRVWRAKEVFHPGQFFAVPGQILYADEGNPVVACDQQTAICLVEVNVGAHSSEDSKKIILKSLRNRFVF